MSAKLDTCEYMLLLLRNMYRHMFNFNPRIICVLLLDVDRMHIIRSEGCANPPPHRACITRAAYFGELTLEKMEIRTRAVNREAKMFTELKSARAAMTLANS